MTIVLDVSAAIEILLNKPQAEKFRDIVKTSEFVIAPDLYISELSNVLWKYHSLSDLSNESCEEILIVGLDFPDQYFSGYDLAIESFNLACISKMTAYDMYYAVLSRRFNAKLLTLDKSLISACLKQNIPVFR